MKNIMLTTLLFWGFLTANSQTSVTPYRAGITTEGITYFLPATGIHITATAIRTIYTPGEYSRYAERYLRLKDVAKHEYEVWTLSDIKLQLFGEADSSRVYTIQLNAKTSAPLVGLAPDGRLLTINTDAEILPPLPHSYVEAIEDKTTLGVSTDFKSREILSAGSKAKMAELTAAEIYDIRENRSLLAKGQADFMPKDGEQLRLMFESLDRQEQTLLQLFTGTQRSEKHVVTLSHVPSGETTDQVLFRFSRHLGFLEKDNLAGEPIFMSIKDLHSLPAAIEEPENKKKKKVVEDLRYILPGKADIRLYTLEKEWLHQNILMSQFGRVEHLGGDLFNKRSNIHVTLSPENGGIIRIDDDAVE
jgi:hypothetical protein